VPVVEVLLPNGEGPFLIQYVGYVAQNLLYPSLLKKVKEFSDVLVDETSLDEVWFMPLIETFNVSSFEALSLLKPKSRPSLIPNELELHHQSICNFLLLFGSTLLEMSPANPHFSVLFLEPK
jgi:hypothetical protein